MLVGVGRCVWDCGILHDGWSDLVALLRGGVGLVDVARSSLFYGVRQEGRGSNNHVSA